MQLRTLVLPFLVGAAIAMPLATPGTAHAWGFAGGGFHRGFGGFGRWHRGFGGWHGGWGHRWGWGRWGWPAFAGIAPVWVPPPIYLRPPPPPIYLAPPPPPVAYPAPAPVVYAVPAPIVHAPRVHRRHIMHVSTRVHHACHCTCSCLRDN